MPFIALLLGFYIIYRVVRNWRTRPAEAGMAAALPADPERDALLQRYSAKIDEDLEREE